MAPRCSIVIPVHNKAALTRQCVDSILESPPRTRFEIVVVDDASTDATPELLESYGDAVRPVRLDRNAGFATACNTGAESGDSEFVVFLNNDTVALPGWLDALAAYADAVPEAAVVGSKLLFPDDTVQHAGVVFGLSGDPLHIYAGCPPDHPAVCKSRPFQVVTAACLLIRRTALEQVGGFDTGYHNDLEDVDLCLRLGELGHEVHLCHESVLYHLESVSRGKKKQNRSLASAKVYRRRWGGRVRSDELDYYLEDGLLEPLRISSDVAEGDERKRLPQAALIQGRSQQIQQLLRDSVRLQTLAAQEPVATGFVGALAGRAIVGAPERRSARRVKRELERQVTDLRTDLAASWGGGAGTVDRPRRRPKRRSSEDAGAGLTGYRRVLAKLPETVAGAVPRDSIVAVVSKGDDRLIEIRGRRGWHFPRHDDGRYAGYYPATGEDAVAHLEQLRATGAGFFVLPSTALWWLDYYPALKQHLEDRCSVVARDDTCLVFDLRQSGDLTQSADEGHSEEGGSVAAQEGEESGTVTPREGYADEVTRVHALVASLAKPMSNVLLISRGDDALTDLDGQYGGHFPQDEDGKYLGYHPATDDDAISHLEQLRSKGAEYLVIPASSMWWLDHYSGFAHHLDGQYRQIARTDDGVIYELAEQLSGEIVSNLLPAGTWIAVASPSPADAYGFSDGFEAEPIVLEDDSDEALREIEAAARRGVRYLVLPKTAFPWLVRHPEAAERVRTEHRLITRQQYACEIYELTEPAYAPDTDPADSVADHPAEPSGEPESPPPGDNAPPRARGPLARLLWGRGQEDGNPHG